MQNSKSGSKTLLLCILLENWKIDCILIQCFRCWCIWFTSCPSTSWESMACYIQEMPGSRTGLWSMQGQQLRFTILMPSAGFTSVYLTLTFPNLLLINRFLQMSPCVTLSDLCCSIDIGMEDDMRHKELLNMVSRGLRNPVPWIITSSHENDSERGVANKIFWKSNNISFKISPD